MFSVSIFILGGWGWGGGGVVICPMLYGINIGNYWGYGVVICPMLYAITI